MPKGHTVVSTKPKRQRQPSGDGMTLKITVKAPGLSPRAVADYVHSAIDSYSGQYDADDARRDIRVVDIQRLAWVHDVVV